jgi:hypothetical protein
VNAHIPDHGSPAERGAGHDLEIETIAIDGSAAVLELEPIHGIAVAIATVTVTVRETK